MSMSLHCSGTVFNPDQSVSLFVLSFLHFLLFTSITTTVCFMAGL